jgi:hypothetical protein
MPLGGGLYALVHRDLTPPKRQRRLKRSLTNCPDMILANDNLVGGAIVAGLLLATTIAGGANGGWFTCFFLAFDFFFSAPVTVV